MAGIFISYRRKEGPAHARLIFQHLRRSPRFWGRVFMDVDGLKPSENFRDKIGKQLDGCTVLLALIGVQWAQLRDEQGVVRLLDERDWVRLEIETALKRGIMVIPVLIDGARMPSAGDLPPGLHSLLDRHAFTLDLAQRFDPGMLELEAAIRPYMPFPVWARAALAGVVLGGAGGGGYVAQQQGASRVVALAETVSAPPAPALPKPVPPGPRVGQVVKDCDVCPELVVLPQGSFVMGSPDSEPEREKDEGPQRRVMISYTLAVGRHEVTQGQWKAVMGSNPSNFSSCGDKCPVENVSWNDAQEYLKKLNVQSGQKYRLLSEAEWEYAARAGTTTPFHTGKTITPEQANFDGNYTYNGSAKGPYLQKTTPVGSFGANAFGLYDMHGNVWEWVEDVWHDNYTGAPTDGTAWEAGGDSARRVLRGGSWNDDPRLLRSAVRFRVTPGFRDNLTGFRIARTFSL